MDSRRTRSRESERRPYVKFLPPALAAPQELRPLILTLECAKRWNHSLNPALDRSEWSAIEVQTLIEATKTYGSHWKEIQKKFFPGRSANDVKNRHTVISRKASIGPNRRRSAQSAPRWSAEPKRQAPSVPTLDPFLEMSTEDVFSLTEDVFSNFLLEDPSYFALGNFN